jgi:outer membrane lipoprotein carrier protein
MPSNTRCVCTSKAHAPALKETLMARVMRNLLQALLVALIVVAAPMASAAEVTEIVAAVEAKYKDVTSLTAKFKQVTKSELFGDEVLAGDLAIERPSKMRWAFGSEKLFVTDGKKMWIYTAEEKQVIEYDDISSQRSTADSLLTSLDKLDEHFKISIISSDAEKGHVLRLEPVEEGQFKSVRLTLDKDLMIGGVVITDTFDNVTELTFSEVVLNAKVEASLFTFSVPDGVDVVKAN